MSGTNLLEGRSGPVTQSVDAVKTLLAFVGRASSPLPTDVTLDNGRLVLILSNDKKCYYVATQKACSCPAATYHHGPCKHQRRYFPQAANTTPAAMESESIRPTGKWPGDMNGPVDTISGEA